MSSDQELMEKANAYLQGLLDQSENYEETLRYFLVLSQTIDQYMQSLEDIGDEYPVLQ